MTYLLPHIQNYFNNKIKQLANPEMRIFERNNKPVLPLKTVHITGVCGTATASLAKLFQDQGITVTGSDQACYPPMCDVLDDMKITVLPFDAKNVNGTDLVIIGNMCPPNNVEAAYCRENNIPHMSMSEAIREFCIRDKQSIVVTGTHGKTTTTGIAIHTFTELHTNPSYLVGGVQQSTGESAHYTDGDLFIIEGDEYDTAYFDKSPKFLHYRPHFVIITSLELDHIDIYKNLEDYTNSFRFLIETTNTDGVLVMCVDDPGVRALYHEYQNDSRIITYGISGDAMVQMKNIVTTTTGESAEIIWQGESQGVLEIPMFGAYNLSNAVAVYCIARNNGFTHEQIANAMKNFKGMKRRQEIFGEKNGITVIDDFAHHPTAVEKTLRGLRERFGDRRLIALFEPRSNSSRSKLFEQEYMQSFDAADMIVFSTPKPKDGYNPDEFMDIDLVINSLQKSGKDAHGVYNADEAVELLAPLLQRGDVVAVMSNGSFDGVHQKLLDRI